MISLINPIIVIHSKFFNLILQQIAFPLLSYALPIIHSLFLSSELLLLSKSDYILLQNFNIYIKKNQNYYCLHFMYLDFQY